MARPRKQSDTADTRDKILRAARIEFAAHGIAAPLEAIAARCGIRRPSLLHHFPSKDALIVAVTDDILRKARERLLDAIGQGKGNYSRTMMSIVAVMRELEAEEHGVGGALIHAMLAEDEQGPVTQKISELIDIIYSTILMAGSSKGASGEEMRAALAHLVMGELTRLALGRRATQLWGTGDGVNPLFRSYFLESRPE
jgi:AcrR family transcriptional regulator